MKNLLIKEMKLAAHPLSYFFILFGIMAIIPGYPILVGAFFVCLGLYNTFLSTKETNDILYTVLLPVKKTDAVKAKYIFTVFIQMMSFILFAVLTIIRMTVWADAPVYVNNAMMNANQAFLGYLLLVFAIFNYFFIPGYFKTAYKTGKSFIVFTVISFIFIAATETIHHFPGLRFLNATDTMGNVILWVILLLSAVIYILVSLASCKKSMRLFEQVDM